MHYKLHICNALMDGLQCNNKYTLWVKIEIDCSFFILNKKLPGYILKIIDNGQ